MGGGRKRLTALLPLRKVGIYKLGHTKAQRKEKLLFSQRENGGIDKREIIQHG